MGPKKQENVQTPVQASVSKSDPAQLSDDDSQNPDMALRTGAVKLAQVNWVTAVRGREDWPTWHYLFKSAASVHLSEALFKANKSMDMREPVWLNAIVRAAQMGNWREMERDAVLFAKDGKTCEALLAELDKRYSRASIVLKQRAVNQLNDLKRGSHTLMESMTAFKKAVSECRTQGYNPDKSVQLMVLNKLLTPNEFLNVELRAHAYGVKDDDAEQLTDIAYELGVKLEAMNGERTTRGFGGMGEGKGGNGKKGGRKGGKNGGNPKRKGLRPDDTSAAPVTGQGNVATPTDSKPCGKCGHKTHKHGTCPAANQKCNKCGEVGHFERCCEVGNKSANMADGGRARPSSGF